jgi:putative transport protein
MSWLVELAVRQPVAHALLVVAAVIALGLGTGALRVRGAALGPAGVLFAGLLIGQLGAVVDADVLSFTRELGLVLFVFAIGMQIGPGFFGSLRAHGLVLNALALAIVLLGVGVAVALGALFALDAASVAGLFAGATTNTPALAAAQEALRGAPGGTPARLAAPAVAYAAAYPLGVLGILGSMALLRAALRIRLADEAREFERAQAQVREPVGRVNLVVDNPNLEGVRVSQIPAVDELGVVITRQKTAGAAEVHAAKPGTVLHRGDTVLAVGHPSGLDQLRVIVGRVADEDLSRAQGAVRSERAVVTRTAVVGKTLAEVALRERFGVTVSRVHRSGVDLTAVAHVRLQFGDMLQLVGDDPAIAQARAAIGDSVRDMQHTNFLPIFVGIALGVALGAVSWPVPGIPSPIKLGLAGGPLVVAITLARIGRIGPLVWYVPASANAALRDLGIVLFLACVGLRAGPQFVQTVGTLQGLAFVAIGAAVTVVPLLVVATFARLRLRMNYLELLGLLAGAMTDPPALAFATATTGSDAPAVAYAAVYPLTMLLRIVSVQVMVVVLG